MAVKNSKPKHKKAVVKPPSMVVEVVDGHIHANSFALAEVIGVSRDTIDNYVSIHGMPKLDKGRFNVYECVEWHRAHIYRNPNSKSELEIERLRLDIEERRLDAEERAGKLLDRESVIKSVRSILLILRNTLNALPRKIATRCAGLTANEVESILSEHLRTAMLELVDAMKTTAHVDQEFDEEQASTTTDETPDAPTR
jgi:phage terminase Nu1 subunit (DNA packaging protein)